MICCHTCARRPKCAVAKPNPHARPVCNLKPGGQECKIAAASGWCWICKRWTDKLEKKGPSDDTQALF